MVTILLLMLLVFSPLSADESTPGNTAVQPLPADTTNILPSTELTPDSFLGMELEEVYSEIGSPLEVFVQRGSKDWQDDVVFFFKENIYLYWYVNRVWQVSVDSGFIGPVLGIRIGEHIDKVLNTFGDPFFEDSESFIYNLPDRGYPVRVRFYFEDFVLTEIYIYRSDF